MRTIQWELADGFPLDQGTMEFLQDESFDRIKALADYWTNSIGIGQFIITGMVKDKDGNISSGWCWLNNKLMYYPGGTYPGTGAVIRPNLVETEVEYEDGVDRAAYLYHTAVIIVGGTGEGFSFDNAKRVPPIKEITWNNLTGIPTNIVYDSNYVHTDNNFTTALLNKLNGIEAGAEKNVQADWAQNDANNDSFIKNKPTTMMLPVVEGTIIYGDVGAGTRTLTVTGDLTAAEILESSGGADDRAVVHFPAVAGNYVRVVNLVDTGNWNADNGVTIGLGPANANNFEIHLRDIDTNGGQKLRIEITILK